VRREHAAIRAPDGRRINRDQHLAVTWGGLRHLPDFKDIWRAIARADNRFHADSLAHHSLTFACLAMLNFPPPPFAAARREIEGAVSQKKATKPEGGEMAQPLRLVAFCLTLEASALSGRSLRARNSCSSRSNSASVGSRDRSASTGTNLIVPSGRISTVIGSPASSAARIARLTSACLNRAGPRLMFDLLQLANSS